MFKWFRDVRYSEVLMQLRELDSIIKLQDSKIETLRTQFNSLRATISANKRKRRDEDEDEDELSDIEREFMAGLAPHELARLRKE